MNLHFKKIGLLVILMGALTLHSCTRYRVAVYTMSDQLIYYPEKKTILKWDEINRTVETDFNGALKTIEADRSSLKPNKIYIKVK